MAVSFSKYFNLLSTYLAPFRRQVIALSLLMLVNIGIMIINPQIIAYYIDQAIGVGTLETLRNAAILYIIFALLLQFVNVFLVYLTQSVSWGATNLLRSDILEHTISLDMTFHNQYKPGDMIERVDGDVNALSNFFSQLVLQLASSILLIFGILFALFLEGWQIGLAFTIFTVIGITTTYFARRIAVPYWKEFRETNMNLFGYIEERISGTEDIRSLGATPNALKKLYKFEEERYSSMMKAIVISRLISATFTGLVGFGVTLVFLIGVPMFQSGAISLGTLVLINLYVGQLVVPIFEILRQIQVLQQADASIERIEELFELESKIKSEGTKLVPPKSSIEFRNVSFSYFEDNKVLNEISFKLESGQKLGLIGRTGSGKTTISRLLYRLYEINSGEILIDNRTLSEYDLDSLRQSIGLVTQDVQLFNSSLKNNITFFDDNISDDRLIEIIRYLNLETWFDQLEKGLETNITQDDVSAGEAQLIALSRIFLQDPEIIILDEASSRLDPATEKILSTALEKIIENKTTIIIAHRLSTLESTDLILELSFGEKIEYGERELLKSDPNSNYSKLLAKGEEVLFA